MSLLFLRLLRYAYREHLQLIHSFTHSLPPSERRVVSGKLCCTQSRHANCLRLMGSPSSSSSSSTVDYLPLSRQDVPIGLRGFIEIIPASSSSKAKGRKLEKQNHNFVDRSRSRAALWPPPPPQVQCAAAASLRAWSATRTSSRQASQSVRDNARRKTSKSELELLSIFAD